VSNFDFDRYDNDGWGLSIEGFKDLYDIITTHDKERLNILEFGSGYSTRFLVDLAATGVKNFDVESYDDSEHWCYKPEKQHDFLDLKIRNLLECTDRAFVGMFMGRQYDPSKMVARTRPPHTRQKNCFYNIMESEGDLTKDVYDLVILDGPNGNGRSIAFLHLLDKVVPGSFIYVDDYDHHPYPKCLELLFDVEIHKHRKVGVNPNDGDAYIIYKVLSKKA